jgi:NADH-quinone oxidoreductase subunit J
MSDGTFAAQALFWLLAAVVISTSIAMMFSRDFVHSSLFFGGALLAFAGLYALLDATFLALIQVFVYAGAVTVVVLFVVMLTRAQIGQYPDLLQKQSWLAGVVVLALAIPIFETINSMPADTTAKMVPAATTTQFATALLTAQAAPFEIASVVLLAALVGAIYLAKEADRP